MIWLSGIFSGIGLVALVFLILEQRLYRRLVRAHRAEETMRLLGLDTFESEKMSYKTVKTRRRVAGTDAEFISRFRWRAERRCKDLNKLRRVDFFRYEVHPEKIDGKWEVWVMQNIGVPLHQTNR